MSNTAAQASAARPADRVGVILVVVSLASALGPFSNLIYAPNLVALRETFQTTATGAGATVSIYGFVLAFSQLVAGPLADRFSAKRLLVGGLLLYTLASLVAFFALRLEVFILARAFQAAGAATGLVMGGAIITDRYPPEGRAKAMGTLQMFNAIGGTLGPLVGSAIAVLYVWQADSIALLIGGLLVTAAAIFFLPEIAAPAQRLTVSATIGVVRYPVTAAVILVAAAQWFGQFTFVAYMPNVLREHVHLPEATIGLFFLPNTLGVLVGSHFGGRLADRHGARRLFFTGGWLSALFVALYSANVLANLGTFTVVALTACHALASISIGLSVPAQLTMMVERFAASRGAAVGTYASLRYFGASVGPVVSGLFLERFGLASGFAVTAVLMALAMAAARLLVNAASTAPPKR